MKTMTFENHVKAIMRERGVNENKAKMMAWLEGPRLEEEGKEK